MMSGPRAVGSTRTQWRVLISIAVVTGALLATFVLVGDRALADQTAHDGADRVEAAQAVFNEMIALVSTDETFSFLISLEEGPNVLEFVASDVDGNEIAFVLTVIYEP